MPISLPAKTRFQYKDTHMRTKELIGVIPSAGKGIRLFPRTKEFQKCLLSIDGESILYRNICIMRDRLGIKLIYIMVGYKENQVRKIFKDGADLGVRLEYIEIDDIKKGLACAILQLERYIKGYFCVILGDEVYFESNHNELLKFIDKDFSAVCAIKLSKQPNIIKKNYSVEIINESIISLVEKPSRVVNNLLGCGTYLFRPIIFEYIRKTPISSISKRVEITDVINLMARENMKVLPFMLKGEYINVNDIDDYNNANYLLRSINFDKKKISLIIPAYNEELSIGYVIDDFKDIVDEIIVVNNNSKDKTESIAKSKGVNVFTGSFKGYGGAIKFGMDNARGDILIITEADGSFFARDLEKILAYLKDADMVIGTRTTKQMTEQAANMNFLLRWGNVFVAKLIELLWIHKGETRLTDVGCTYRGIWKTDYCDIKDFLRETGPEFSPEMIIEAIRYNKRVIEIPVTYSSRIGGESKFSKNILSNAKIALKMLRLIFQKKILDF